MAQNFLGCDREQAFLLPPSLDEWLGEDHFARFVIAMVEEMDLAAFYVERPSLRIPPERLGERTTSTSSCRPTSIPTGGTRRATGRGCATP
jgi:hypothetical protein